MWNSKTQLQKRLNISLPTILLKSTNSNILDNSLQGKLKTYMHLTNFQLILINLQTQQFFSKFTDMCVSNTRVLKEPSKG